MHFNKQSDYTAYLTEGDKPLENYKIIPKEEIAKPSTKGKKGKRVKKEKTNG